MERVREREGEREKEKIIYRHQLKFMVRPWARLATGVPPS